MFAPGMSFGQQKSQHSTQAWDSFTTYLADKALVTDPLFCILGGIKSDLLLTRIDDVGDLEIQHKVQLKHTI